MSRIPNQFLFRAAMLGLASLLGLQALWILPSTFNRSTVRALPLNTEAAALASAHRRTALWDAYWATVRGELWADAAFTHADLLWRSPDQAARETASVQDARLSANRAVTLAPARADAWLLLAALAHHLGWSNFNLAALLKMSYLTGPSELSLLPMRLLQTVHSNALNDPDIAQFVRRDLRAALIGRPELRPAVVTAHQAATPAIKGWLEHEIGTIDATFLTSLRSQ